MAQVKRYSWTEGWHDDPERIGFSYFVEEGKLVRAMRCDLSGARPLHPYVSDGNGGLDKDTTLDANKKNYRKIKWH